MDQIFAHRNTKGRLALGLAGMALAISLSNCNNSEQSPVSSSEAAPPTTQQAQPAIPMTEGKALGKISGNTTYLNFQDRQSCQWNSNICKNTFVVWPGYIQSTGYNEWGYVWMSNGPGTGPLPYIAPKTPTPSESSYHYHIGGLLHPATEPNPKASSMSGRDWLWVSLKRNSVRVNFDLTEIKVLGTTSIRLWYKDAYGNGYEWSNLPPGWWYLPGATNIQEAHISSASGLSGDLFQVDDIQVTSR